MKSKRPAVLVLYNIPRQADLPAGCAALSSAEAACLESDAGVLAEVEAVSAALDRLGVRHRAAGIRVLGDLPSLLADSDEPIVFNLVEGLHRQPVNANYVPAMCEAFGKGCTGNDSASMMLSLDKWQTKAALQAAGLPTPAATVVPVGGKLDLATLPEGALIIKPAATDASEGIDADSIVAQPGPGIKRIVRRIHEQFNQPALVEQFVGRRELNVSVLQRGDRVDVLPIAEIDFGAFDEGRPRIVGYTAKWLAESFEYNNTPRVIPAPLSARVAQRVQTCALGAWRALGCRDYARVDFRLDDQGQPSILEVNPNPDISPDAGFAAALAAAGLKYEQFVRIVIKNAGDRRTADGKAGRKK